MSNSSTTKRPGLKALRADNDLRMSIAGHIKYHDPKRGGLGGFRHKFLYTCYYKGVACSSNDTRDLVDKMIHKLRQAKRI